MRNKKDDLEIFLRDNPYDLIGLSETWLDEYISNNLIAIIIIPSKISGELD